MNGDFIQALSTSNTRTSPLFFSGLLLELRSVVDQCGRIIPLNYLTASSYYRTVNELIATMCGTGA